MQKSYKVLALLFAVLFITFSVNAQDTKKNVIKASLLSPIVRTGSFFYERALNEDMSFQMGFFYSGISFEDTRYRGFGITPEFRYYLSDKPAPAGIFIAPYARYQNLSLSSGLSTADATYSGLGGGLLIGAQRILKNTITMEAFIGPSYFNGKVKVSDGGENTFETGIFDGFKARFGFTLGLAL
jgi:hypothetical protein